MLILGVHGGLRRVQEDNRTGFARHDGAAVLLEDGRIVAAIEEERLNRIKHSNYFPARAIARGLRERGVRLGEVDRIAINSQEAAFDARVVDLRLGNSASRRPTSGRAFIGELFRDAFGVQVAKKLRFVDHHEAHAHSAFGVAGLDRALVLVLDGDGDAGSGAVYLAEDGGGRGARPRLSLLRRFSSGQSLGHLYADLIEFIGFSRFDEYKAMGLAPYGDPARFRALFKRGYRLLPEGDFALVARAAWTRLFAAEGLVERARRSGEPFSQVHRDFAAGLQEALERIVFHVLRHLRRATGERNLCFAGGVAHNCSLNGKVRYAGLFDQIFVQPAAHDAGGALGAALAVHYSEGARSSRSRMDHLYLGAPLPGAAALGRRLEPWRGLVSFSRPRRIEEAAARLIADGAVVGWVQGRSEFGPRALGNRSILADPRPGENKQRINAMIKKREAFRPFAPAVLEERVGEIVALPRGQTSFPFMIEVLRVRPRMRSQLAAVTHVDGTARVQTVSRETNPRFWSLIAAFARLTGTPVLLNTSFNNHAEPIVDSPEDALACFLTTEIDALVLGDWLVRRRPRSAVGRAFRDLVPRLPENRRLTKSTRFDGARARCAHQIVSTSSRYFCKPEVAISASAYAVLEGADGVTPLGRLLARAGIAPGRAMREVLSELHELWGQRVVVLSPRPRRSKQT